MTPEEYKEFLSLGHGEIFTLDIDMVVNAPWRCAGPRVSEGERPRGRRGAGCRLRLLACPEACVLSAGECTVCLGVGVRLGT